MESGYILWEGKSLFDGKPIVVLGTGFASSNNRKTGKMIQIWIMRSDVNPLEAINYGKDSSICGNCRHRPTTKHNPNGWGSCYVHVSQAPLQVYRAYQTGKYRPLEHADWPIIFAGRRVRLGAYGDPAAVPYEVWNRIVTNCDHHTGYTHQWSHCDQRLKDIVMASVDTPEEYERAQAMGWRSFRVRMENEPLNDTERVCPASEEAGKKATCSTCMACHGGGSQKASIAITIHGGTWKPKRFVQIRVLQKAHKPYRPLLRQAVKNRQQKDTYYKKGYRVEVTRDRRGNPVSYKKTKLETVGCT